VIAPSLTALQAAHQRTLELVSAHIELVSDRGWEMPAMPSQRRGGLLRPLLNGTKWAAKQSLANATRDFDFRHQSAEGVLDMTARVHREHQRRHPCRARAPRAARRRRRHSLPWGATTSAESCSREQFRLQF
jgi:hypothetical protein